MKTRAAVLYEVGQPLVIEELELAPPGEGEILIRYVASGICHSDYSFRAGSMDLALPAVLGHEGAGIVENVGPGVTDLAPGDRVVLSLSPQCGECAMCREGKAYFCTRLSKVFWKGSLLDGSRRLRNGRGQEIGQLLSLGTFAERAVVPAGTAVKVGAEVPLETVCLVGCGVTTGMGAALNTVQIRPGDSCAVIGCGGVGLAVVQGARIAGAALVIAIDPVAEKRELALQLGATHAVDPGDGNATKTVRKLSDGGVHFAFEALGRKDTIEQAWQMARLTGTAVIVGVPERGTVLDIPVLGFFGEKHLKGCAYGSAVPASDIPRFIDLFMRGELKLDAMITRRIRLEQVNEALDEMGRGQGARSVIVYG